MSDDFNSYKHGQMVETAWKCHKCGSGVAGEVRHIEWVGMCMVYHCECSFVTALKSGLMSQNEKPRYKSDFIAKRL